VGSPGRNSAVMAGPFVVPATMSGIGSAPRYRSGAKSMTRRSVL